MYCITIYKEVGRRKGKDNIWLTMFETGRTDTEAPNETSPASLPSFPHWHHPFLVPLLSSATISCGGGDGCVFLQPKLKSSKVCFVLSALYAHSSHDERWWFFLRQLQQLVELLAADQLL